LATGPIEDALKVGVSGLVGRHRKFVSVRPDGDNFRVVATRETRSANHDQRCEDCQSRKAVLSVDVGHGNLHLAKKHDDQRTREYAEPEENRLMYPKFVQTRPSVIYKGETSVVSTGKRMTGGQGAMKAAHHGVRTFGVLPLVFSARSGVEPSTPLRAVGPDATYRRSQRHFRWQINRLK
jgi:hypothetical protein